MKPQILIKEQNTLNDLSQEAIQILEILDQIESHTTNLRTKLLTELKSKSESINIKLEKVEQS